MMRIKVKTRCPFAHKHIEKRMIYIILSKLVKIRMGSPITINKIEYSTVN